MSCKKHAKKQTFEAKFLLTGFMSLKVNCCQQASFEIWNSIFVESKEFIYLFNLKQTPLWKHQTNETVEPTILRCVDKVTATLPTTLDPRYRDVLGCTHNLWGKQQWVCCFFRMKALIALEKKGKTNGVFFLQLLVDLYTNYKSEKWEPLNHTI